MLQGVRCPREGAQNVVEGENNKQDVRIWIYRIHKIDMKDNEQFSNILSIAHLHRNGIKEVDIIAIIRH